MDGALFGGCVVLGCGALFAPNKLRSDHPEDFDAIALAHSHLITYATTFRVRTMERLTKKLQREIVPTAARPELHEWAVRKLWKFYRL